MKVTIHRGTHEIGGSCVELEHNGSRIILDLGMPLINPDGSRFNFNDHKKLSGPELVKNKILPDIKGLYPWAKENKSPDGLFISHSHMDHYGLSSFIRDDIPVYLGKGTYILIELTNFFLKRNDKVLKDNFIRSSHPVEIGSFRVTPFLMDHSAFDSYAFMIEAGGKTIIYSGDFRAHGRKGKTLDVFLKKVGGRTVDALLLEGSLISRGAEGHRQKTEQEIEAELVELIKQTPGIIFINQSSQNIDRLVSCFKATLRTRRLFVIDLYTACILDELKDFWKLPHASSGDFKNIRVFYPRNLAISILKKGRAEILEKFKPRRIHMSAIKKYQHRTVMLYRPSMNDELNKAGIFENGRMIYSMWSGYLSDASMKGLHDFVGVHELDLKQIHTSGHADVETLKRVIDSIKPVKLIPIHTMDPEAYKNLYPNVWLVEDGEKIALDL
jgi:ribonuclease J